MKGPPFRGSYLMKHMHKPSRAYFSTLPAKSQIQQSEEGMTPTSTSNRIHILGQGNIGRLFAHGLATIPKPPPITLLFHRESLLEEWKQAGECITITDRGIPSTSRNYDIEIINSQDTDSKSSIMNLIVATKTTKTLQAISAVADRLSRDSTIMFTQNGMGTIEEVTESLFPYPGTRPTYTTATVYHGLFSTSPFSSVLPGKGKMALSHHLGTSSTPMSKSMLTQVRPPRLFDATVYQPNPGFTRRIAKLTANAIINPLSVLFQKKNGELFESHQICALMYLLIAEIDPVLFTYCDRSTKGNGDDKGNGDRAYIRSTWKGHVGTRFMTEDVLIAARRSAENYSSMLQDVKAGRETEIDYINGWLVKKGLEYGLDMSVNQKVIEMVKSNKKLELEDIEPIFGQYHSTLDRGMSIRKEWELGYPPLRIRFKPERKS
ncbi:hypothetical protein HYALB_00008837 [Hymenoscyphus albidus]|uniref:2-dehydropantoate 2-reductase n=1 Tax=Hymenoscyphus albidus TaxID=595503 RepID=A0A9N9LSU5_9HELO|nr:hypothetical protein HYALB_00008837 [Hymenoscyphus albidus]